MITPNKANCVISVEYGVDKEINLPPGEFIYDIDSVSLKSADGEPLTELPQNEDFTVAVEFTEKYETSASNTLLAAVYGEDGVLLYIGHVNANFDENGTVEFDIPAQEKTIGSVKALIWNSLDSVEPLAESVEIK